MVKKKRGKQGQGFWKDNYRKSWDYIKESRNFIYAVIIIFVFFILIGALLPTPEIIEQRILEFIRQLLETTDGMSSGQLMSFIFLNNLQSSFFFFIFGVVLGIFSVLTVILNGYLLGFVSARAINIDGIFVLWRLVPHGIFELPAVLISMGLGLKLGTFIFRKKKIKSLKEFLMNSLRVFVFVIIPLLIIAAIIEGFLISFG